MIFEGPFELKPFYDTVILLPLCIETEAEVIEIFLQRHLEIQCSKIGRLSFPHKPFCGFPPEVKKH